MVRRILNFIAILICICSVYLLLSYNTTSVNIDTSNMYILNSFSNSSITRRDSDNIVKCDLTGFSNYISNLQNEGFIIYNADYERDIIDIILTKDDEIYRAWYTKDGVMTVVSKPYQNSTIGETYISGKINK